MINKRLIVWCLAVQLITVEMMAQDNSSKKDTGLYHREQTDTVKSSSANVYHLHLGFYIEGGAGAVFGTVTYTGGGYYHEQYGGTGLAFELRLGGAVKKNLVVTAAILVKTVSSAPLKVNGKPDENTPGISVTEMSYGPGITYYSTPSDIFGSATLGVGTFNFSGEKQDFTTHMGFSGQFKVGKHWWLSDQWGISLGAAYGFTSVHYTNVKYIETEDFSSNRFAIIASLTYH